MSEETGYHGPEDEPVDAGDEGVEPAQSGDETGPASWSDLQAEQYERAAFDPEYARMLAIEVDVDYKTQAWENEGGVPLYGDPDDLPVHDADEDVDDDGSEEV